MYLFRAIKPKFGISTFFDILENLAFNILIHVQTLENRDIITKRSHIQREFNDSTRREQTNVCF